MLCKPDNYPKQVIPRPARRPTRGDSNGGSAAGGRLGDMSAVARIVQRLPDSAAGSVQSKRRLVAELCRLVGRQLIGNSELRPSFPKVSPTDVPGLSPRLRETLRHLMAGDSEKEAAAKMRISRHTLHVYVKLLYRRFEVSSRGELLSKFLPP